MSKKKEMKYRGYEEVMSMTHNTAARRDLRALPSVLVFIIVSFLSITLMSCGKGDDDKVQRQAQPPTENYQGWDRYSNGQFTLAIAPASPFLADGDWLAEAYNDFLTQICSLLELPVPEGDVHLYIYESPQEMEALTGKGASFMTDSTIHWDGRSPYGYQLAKFILAKNDIRPGRFQVVYEGIANLLDFSGVNYHLETANLSRTDFYVSLDNLGEDSVFNAMAEPMKRAESASLAGFIMYNYGTDRLLALAQSREGWKETMEALFQMDLADFERSWLEFAQEHGENPEGVGEEATP